jgi:tetratricopeptide (TPR) repeat protein
MRIRSWFQSALLPAREAPVTAPPESTPLDKRVFQLLAVLAILYAFLAALRTLPDPDLGWQMASGRWIVQHHQVPSTDVFSFTVSGTAWIYPFGAEVLFYGLYLIGGYALLSWFGAAVCAGTIAILLRRGSAFTAAIAIIVVPLIAQRSAPRAEVFTTLLFAAYLSLLWENYETGRARLVWLPLLMVAWVNLHLGFISGLALIGGFIGLDVLELLFGTARRQAALDRLRRAWPWYLATALVTVINPWGWNLYSALVRQNRAMATHARFIAEWGSAHWSWHGSMGSFSEHPIQTSLAIVMLVVVVGGCAALLQARPGSAILLAGALYATMHYIRMEALTACVVTVVGGAVFSAAAAQLTGRLPNARARSLLAIAGTAAMAAIAVICTVLFVSDHIYLAGNSRTNFGAGLSWWFPEAAADFVVKENLPPEVFNSFNEGGFILWKLGEKYRDYMDGRSIPFGVEAFERERELLGSPLDSPRWQQEADKYNLNTILVQLDSEEIAFDQMQDLCNAANWRPVYLDEVAMVLVRNTPKNEDVIRRLQISCPTAPIPATPLARNTKTFRRWLNSAYILLALRRTSEALIATDNAQLIFPDSSSLHWVRGNILYAGSRRGEAEQEWLTALSLTPGQADAAVWSRLGELYTQQDRIPEALHAWQQTIQFTGDAVLKANAGLQVARLELKMGRPKEALQALDQAVHNAPPQLLALNQGRSFSFEVAQGRAASSRRLGDLAQAITFQEQAVQLDPDAGEAWLYLAKLYQQQGRTADQQRAEARAKSLGTTAPAP